MFCNSTECCASPFSYGSIDSESQSTAESAKKTAQSSGAFFSDSQFLVFLNRWAALALSGALLWLTRAEPNPNASPNPKRASAERLSPSSSPQRSLGSSSDAATTSSAVAVVVREPPFALYLYSSLANIVSSWMQYEALKYVSFPTQARVSVFPFGFFSSLFESIFSFLFSSFLHFSFLPRVLLI